MTTIKSVLIALVSSTAVAQVTTYEIAGQLTDAQNLTFAVINGNLLSANPQPGDLPLTFSGSLVVDESAQTAVFEFGGSFTSPTRAYTFDVISDNIFAGVAETTTSGVSVTFFDTDVEIVVDIDSVTQTGSFNYTQFGAVPTSPPQSVFADGVVTSVSVVQTGGNLADLVEPFGVLDLADVDAFVVAFTNTDPSIDLAAPFGVIDLGDVDAFIDAFLTGLP